MEVRSGCGDVAAQEEVASEGTFLVQVVVVHGGGADEEGILHSGRMSGASACAWLVGDEDILPCSPYPFSQEAVGTTVISQILHYGVWERTTTRQWWVNDKVRSSTAFVDKQRFCFYIS